MAGGAPRWDALCSDRQFGGILGEVGGSERAGCLDRCPTGRLFPTYGLAWAGLAEGGNSEADPRPPLSSLSSCLLRQPLPPVRRDRQLAVRGLTPTRSPGPPPRHLALRSQEALPLGSQARGCRSPGQGQDGEAAAAGPPPTERAGPPRALCRLPGAAGSQEGAGPWVSQAQLAAGRPPPAGPGARPPLERRSDLSPTSRSGLRMIPGPCS